MKVYTDNGNFVLRYVEESEDGQTVVVREIPAEAIASWSELLGYDDLAQVVNAILHVQDHGEPEPDPVTGANVWTDAYELLTAREQARERAALEVVQEGTADNPQGVQLRSSMAAYQAVHVPIDGGECVMDRCRRSARDRLGLPEPHAKTKATSRLMTHAPLSSAQGEAATALEQVAPLVETARREFLHSLTGLTVNPLEDTPADVPVEEDDPFAATLRKYGATRSTTDQ